MKPTEEQLRDAGDVCKKCRASIVWATTPAGKAMPIDPELVYGGNVELSVDDVGMLRATVVKAAGDVERRVAHFTSCPDAEAFRKKPPEKRGPLTHEEQEEAKRDAGRRTMPFGKFAGEYLDDIFATSRGKSYLEWAYEKLSLRDPTLKQAIGVVIGAEEPS